MNKKELMTRIEDLSQTISEKDQKIGMLTAQMGDLKQQNQQAEDKYAKLNDAYYAMQDYAKSLENQIGKLNVELKQANADLNRERSISHDITKLKGYIARLVEPVTREEVDAIYRRNYHSTETATSFLLTAMDDNLQLNYAIPKADLRQRRSTGSLTNLLAPTYYPTLLNDPGFQGMFPHHLLTAPSLIFGKLLPNGTFQLRDPRSAEHVVAFMSVNGATWLQWRVAHKNDYHMLERRVEAKEDAKKGSKQAEKPEEDVYEVSIVLPFPGEDDSMCFKPELDQDATAEDLAVLRKQREDSLRQYCYQQYLSYYFDN